MASAPTRMKEKLAELAMTEGISGRKELLEGAALIVALKPQNHEEMLAGVAVLRELGIDSLDETFHKLMKLGEVGACCLDWFIALKSELVPAPVASLRPSGLYPKEPQKAKPFISWKALGDDEALERSQEIVTKNAITNLADLQARFRGVFVELHRRGLLDCIEYAEKPESPIIVAETVTFRRRHIRGPEHWEDDEVIQRAQEAIVREGFSDLRSFGERYRGINLELARRGLTDHLNFQASA